ncbi:transcription factor IIA alpha/beta subunit [Favolaschia claudopus]|uniref:Transcription factor IIA alpha/beta subunit n=1 Tax=Favolaschia claudopus TaxID=2862362 RepID=A0AAW0C538_9AGAR
MSNKIVPSIYRAVIDDVIDAIRPEFEEFGVSADLVEKLRDKWEMKIVASRVADFPVEPSPSQPTYPYPTLPHATRNVPAYVPPSAAQQRSKSGGIDARYALATAQYAFPPLPGPTLPAQNKNTSTPVAPVTAALSTLPQTDGPSVSEDDDLEPVPVPTRIGQPSGAPVGKGEFAAGKDPAKDAEQIGSDLDDDSDDSENDAEDGEEAQAEIDMVFCTYDKVARVKNKWKCVLKDGMIHAGGKDYLFQRCTGEFEW